MDGRERHGTTKRSQDLNSFALVAASATGWIGSPVAAAARMTPGCTSLSGPRGPSGVKAMSQPSAALRSRVLIPTIPPRLLEPRLESMPSRATVRAISSPSLLWLTSTEIRRPR